MFGFTGYLMCFAKIFYNDNVIVKSILPPGVSTKLTSSFLPQQIMMSIRFFPSYLQQIHHRNQRNVVTMVGQSVNWSFQLFLMGMIILLIPAKSNLLNPLLYLSKMLHFFFLPLIDILTSPALRGFWASHHM